MHDASQRYVVSKQCSTNDIFACLHLIAHVIQGASGIQGGWEGHKQCGADEGTPEYVDHVPEGESTFARSSPCCIIASMLSALSPHAQYEPTLDKCSSIIHCTYFGWSCNRLSSLPFGCWVICLFACSQYVNLLITGAYVICIAGYSEHMS